jgi:hypothetical protein
VWAFNQNLQTEVHQSGANITKRTPLYLGWYGHGRKLTLLMAISGDPNDNLRWYDLEERPGISFDDFTTCILRVLKDLPPGNAQCRRCFTMDNLSAHHHGFVPNAIIQAGHWYVLRAPYHPVDGPIEYVFHTIELLLALAMYEVHDIADLIPKMQEVIQDMNMFNQYFQNCGYRN